MAIPYTNKMIVTVFALNPVTSCNNGDKYVKVTNVLPYPNAVIMKTSNSLPFVISLIDRGMIQTHLFSY